MAAKGACVYEHALTWALEAEKLDLPRVSARCERFIVKHWEHLHKYALLIDSLSSPARRRVMMGMSHALQSTKKGTITCQPCSGAFHNINSKLISCNYCAGTGRHALWPRLPSVEDFMSWRTTPGGAS